MAGRSSSSRRQSTGSSTSAATSRLPRSRMNASTTAGSLRFRKPGFENASSSTFSSACQLIVRTAAGWVRRRRPSARCAGPPATRCRSTTARCAARSKWTGLKPGCSGSNAEAWNMVASQKSVRLWMTEFGSNGAKAL
ncbi:hypothetical protein BO443_170020 [Burkholderia orbicola]